MVSNYNPALYYPQNNLYYKKNGQNSGQFVQNPICINCAPYAQANTFQYPQYSLYSNNAVYPYNPVNIIPSGSNYTSLGQFQTSGGDTIYMFRLNNGQEVAIMPRKDEATIVKTFVNAGAINEFDQHKGGQHVIEHGEFMGSDKLQNGDVFRLTSLMGASTNASTDFAKIDYYIEAPEMNEQNLAKTIEIQGDMVYNPKFDKELIEFEKGPICSEISMMNDDPTTVAFDRVVRNLFQIESDAKNIVAGSISTVQGLTCDDLRKYHATYYTPKKLKTVIVGDVDVQKTIDLVAKNFVYKNSPNQGIEEYHMPLNPLDKSIREDIISPKTNLTNIFLAFCGPKPQDAKDFVIAHMLDFYLNNCSTSKLKNGLEKMSANSCMTMQKVGLDNYPQAIVNMLSMNPNEEQKGIDLFYDSIEQLQTIPLSDDEMKAIKSYMSKNFEFLMCDSSDICDFIGTSLLDKDFNLLTNYKNLIASVTKEDIINFAKKYYDLNKASIVVVHPASVKKDDILNNYSNSKYSFNNVSKRFSPASKISFCANKKVSVSNVKEYQLANKTRLAINQTNSSLCVFNWSVNTPPIKPKNPNIPAVLMYMFTKGTDFKNQVELEKYQELNGIDTDIFVNGRSIEISANCLSDQADATLKLLNELMYHPKLTQNDFEEAKKVVKDTLLTSSKDAGSNLLDKTYPGFFPTNDAMLKTIDDLTLDDVKEFYRNLLNSAKSVFVATLPQKDIDNLTSSVIRNQSILEVQFKEAIPNLSPVFKANQSPNVIYDTDNLNQAQIYKSYNFPLSGNIEDEIRFELVNTILGGTPNSRLFSDLREKQNLAYSVSSYIKQFENTGILTLAIQTTTDNPDENIKSFDNVKKSLEGFKQHTDRLCNELVSDEELQAAKTKLRQNIIGQCQNPISETGLLAMNMQEPHGINRIDKYFEAIDKMTKEDVLKAAKYIFSYNPTISILASPDTMESQMEYLKTQGTVEQAVI